MSKHSHKSELTATVELKILFDQIQNKCYLSLKDSIWYYHHIYKKVNLCYFHVLWAKQLLNQFRFQIHQKIQSLILLKYKDVKHMLLKMKLNLLLKVTAHIKLRLNIFQILIWITQLVLWHWQVKHLQNLLHQHLSLF